MRNPEQWRDLHRRRFSDVPFDCGRDHDPGVIYSEDLRDWSDKATTEDQWRIEHYIDRFDLRSKRILHIGIGNSGLAQRFHRRVKDIVGTTIDQPEIDVAKRLGLSGYRYVVHNKYAGHDDVLPGRFDLIVDNNPTSPCCCFKHLGVLFDLYSDKLAPGGQIVTDRIGLRWIPDGASRQWSFDFDDLAAVASVAGFSAFRINRNVYVIARQRPPVPGYAAFGRHLWRRTKAMPGQIARLNLRDVRRAVRGMAKAAVLGLLPAAAFRRGAGGR